MSVSDEKIIAAYLSAKNQTNVDSLKELLKLIRSLIKSISSLIGFIGEINNVLLLTRDILKKQEQFLSEVTGEL